MTVSLTYQEVEDYLNDIALGQRAVYLDGEVYILKYPSQDEIFKSRIVYKKALEEAKIQNLPSVEKVEGIIKDRGLFTQEDEDKIKELQSKIEGQKAVLEKTVRVPARRERLLEIIKELEKQVRDIRRKKDSLLEGTQESKAKEEQYLYLLQLNCFSFPEESRYWDTKKEFENEKNFILRTKLYYEYIGVLNGIDTPTIRFLARSALFKIRHQNSLKSSAPLFDRPVFHYTNDMLNLSYWGHFYHSIYEMMPEDIPPDHIVENDALLDAHMEAIYKERSQQRAEAQARARGRGHSSAWGHDEVIVTKSNPMFQDIEYDRLNKKRSGTESEVTIKSKSDESSFKRKL